MRRFRRRRSAFFGCERRLMGYSKVNVHELEPAGPGGAVRFVRRELDLLAFGINWFELAPNADGRRHNELKLIRSALHSYLDDFGHNEADVMREIKQLLEKLPYHERFFE